MKESNEIETRRRGELFPHLATLLLCGAVGLLAACDDSGPLDIDEPGDEVEVERIGVVVGSTDLSLTIFPLDGSGATRTVGLGPAGTPVSLAVHGKWAVVPLGLVPAIAIVDLEEGTVVRTISLPEGSGATDAAFANDSVVVVTNPGLNTVSPVNIRSGTVGTQIPVGIFPQFIVEANGRLVVTNAEIGPDFLPAGPSTVTILDGGSFEVLSTVTLSGGNAGGASVDPDGRVWVVNSGSYLAPSGSVSVVNPSSGLEVAHHEGFGDLPGSIAYLPGAGVLTASYSYGIAQWDPSEERFLIAPDSERKPGGFGSVAAVAKGPDGELWALDPTCNAPGNAIRFDAGLEVEATVRVGACPSAIAFTEIEVVH